VADRVADPVAPPAPQQAAAPEPSHPPGPRLLWPLFAAPGVLWLAVLFVAPMYVVLAILFGQVDPVLRQPVPVWNPVQWNTIQFRYVLDHIVGEEGYFGPVLVRTAVYVLSASVMCLVVAYPVAYYLARFAGRWKGVLLVLLVAPFWISYMMRMLAWVNLLQNDGLVNAALGTVSEELRVDWLTGHGPVVVLGLVYGYVPYMILPLFAGLDRIPQATLEAARDLGAGRLETFRRVTFRMSLPAVVTSVLLTCLPMLGDYFTTDLLSGTPGTTMVGNLINGSVLTPGQTGQAAAFVLLVTLVSLGPMLLYVWVGRDREGVAS
jgi:spermidine/putrescine transport system permease protein